MTSDEVIGIVLEAEKERGLSVDGRRRDCLIFRDRNDVPLLILDYAPSEWRATFPAGKVSHDSTAAQVRAYLDAEELGGRYARKETRP